MQKKDSEMCIGFDFGTIQDAEYFNDEYVSGSTNILLLVLTRGFMKLYENMHTSVHNQKRTVVGDDLRSTDDCGTRKLLKFNSQKSAIEFNITNEFKHCTASRKRVTSSEIEESLFLGANSSGILVRVHVEEYLFKLWMIGIFSVIF